MAENVQWALKNEGRGRLLVFAHDVHVMNWKDDEPRWAAVRDKPSMMGSHLRSVYGEDVYIIATSFATASTALPTTKPQEDGLDRSLAGLGLPLMLLDLRMARQNKDALASLSRRRPLDAVISTNLLVTPSSAFDGLFFVNRLTPAIPTFDRAQ
jgi:erythromycin esterase-like protein